MRKLFPIVIGASLCLLSFSSAAENEFCKGYEEGFKEGWCYEQGLGCMEPMTPMCPLARLGEDTYKDGYNRGFTDGKKKRNR
jgi:hypothetical protein